MTSTLGRCINGNRGLIMWSWQQLRRQGEVDGSKCHERIKSWGRESGGGGKAGIEGWKGLATGRREEVNEIEGDRVEVKAGLCRRYMYIGIGIATLLRSSLINRSPFGHAT